MAFVRRERWGEVELSSDFESVAQPSRVCPYSSMPSFFFRSKTMINPDLKTCSICGERFGCGANDSSQSCWCEELPRVEIVTGMDCRCPKCLGGIVNQQERGNERGTPPVELVEGVDYYLEGSCLVFTALYHLKRGYCCESGCRHCPYVESTTVQK